MQHKWKVLTIVSVAIFMGSLDLFIVNVAFPDIAAEFGGASLSDLSWVLNAFAIVFAALLVPSGRMADRFGRKRFFVGGLVTFIVGSTLCGLAPSLEALVAARVIQAAGVAAMAPTSLALLLPQFEPAERPTAIAIWSAAGGIAAAVGPPLGGLLVTIDWRLIFFVNIPVGLLALYFAVRTLDEARDESATELPDLVGTALLITSVTALSLGLVKSNQWGWTGTATIVSFVVSAITAAWFVRRSSRLTAPVLDLDLFRVRSYAMANVASLFFYAAFSAGLLVMVLFLTQVWGESELTAGLWLATGPAAAAIASVPSGKLGARVGQGYVAAAGSFLFALATGVFALRVTTTPEPLSVMTPSWIVGGIGVGMVLPTVAGTVAAALPPARFATGSAVMTTSRQIGAVVGVALLIPVLGTPDPADPIPAFTNAWLLIIGLMLTAAVAGLLFGKVTQNTEVAPAEELAPAQLAPINEPEPEPVHA
jgi:EmrB/QacA subfamily drug resistance transporter